MLLRNPATVRHTRTSVGHAQQEGLLVLELKVLVLELLSVDALTTSSIASSEVTTLDHERLDDTVERRALVVERLAILALALLAGTQCAEVFGGLGDDIVVLGFKSVSCDSDRKQQRRSYQLKGDTASTRLANVDVEEDTAALGLCHFRCICV